MGEIVMAPSFEYKFSSSEDYGLYFQSSSSCSITIATVLKSPVGTSPVSESPDSNFSNFPFP